MSPLSKNAQMALRRVATAAAILLALPAAQTVCAASTAEARHRLQQQQLRDTLDLNQLQSAWRFKADMSPADTLRLDQLQLRQRIEQQQLEQHQLQRGRVDRNRGDADSLIQQHRLAQERQLQLQQFDMEQRELLRTIKPQPLQRPAPAGELQP